MKGKSDINLTVMQQAILNQAMELFRLGIEAESERQRIEAALVAAMRERKVLETLREKEWEAYRVEQQRETAAELAEFMGHSVFTEQEGM